eukprot:1392797-Prymnesium_polylepis.1
MISRSRHASYTTKWPTCVPSSHANTRARRKGDLACCSTSSSAPIDGPLRLARIEAPLGHVDIERLAIEAELADAHARPRRHGLEQAVLPIGCSARSSIVSWRYGTRSLASGQSAHVGALRSAHSIRLATSPLKPSGGNLPPLPSAASAMASAPTTDAPASASSPDEGP